MRRKHDARRDRIVEAAFAAIAKEGAADFSMNQLARELDYTPGALYWYFPAKDALVLEVQSRAFSQLTTMLQEARQRWQQSPAVEGCAEPTRALHTLLCDARWYLRLDQEAPSYTRLISFSLDPRVLLDTDSAKNLMVVLGALFTESAKAFAAAQQASALAPRNVIRQAVQYWAALHGCVATSKLARLNAEMFQTEVLGMDSAEALLLGWGAPKALLEDAGRRMATTEP